MNKRRYRVSLQSVDSIFILYNPGGKDNILLGFRIPCGVNRSHVRGAARGRDGGGQPLIVWDKTGCIDISLARSTGESYGLADFGFAAAVIRGRPGLKMRFG